MKRLALITLALLFACKGEQTKAVDVQELVDASIATAGGERYRNSVISFDFRDHHYILEPGEYNKVLKRVQKKDSVVITDIKRGKSFQRLIDGKPVQVHDTMAVKFSNSVNSVHYFAYLPYGLNDAAVNKEYLGEAEIEGKKYHEVKVTFEQEGGGKDHEDVYIYWFNQETLKPDFLAYEYHTDGGGRRFRKAFNERYVEGIRFVDYYNYAYEPDVAVEALDSLYQAGNLELLSTIALENVSVSPGNYN